jgi:phytoene dehydrogenase-like protein
MVGDIFVLLYKVQAAMTKGSSPASRVIISALGMERGAPFASAHTFFQTGPFRPRNMAKGYENIVFAGSGTQPGVGVPMVLISGKLAAERII